MITSSDNEPLRSEPAAPLDSAGDPAAAPDGAPRLPFPVVGIGASAGGVEALQRFFAAVPPGSGMAYVVIQHLSPEHKSLMVEILGRCTSMPVHQIEDEMRVEADHVYVIRPGRTITLENGQLRMGEVLEKAGHRRPVDDFFRSLAREQRERAIAVVLSGTGTNGSAGAQAIKAAGGLCIAQDPETADFPGMPQSLIQSGYADRILRTEEIPGVLRHYMQQALGGPDAAPALSRQMPKASQLEQQLRDILQILRARTGHDFSPYKAATVLRRVQRRMDLVGATELESYGTRLRESTVEVTALANDLMINVTGFFRDPEAWEALRESVIRPLVLQRPGGEAIRAWVTACASGEEAYSLAMLIAEAERMQLHAVIEQLPAAVLLVAAPSGKLLYGNRRAAALFKQPYPLPFIGYDWTAVYSAFRGSHGDQRPFEPREWPLARALAAGEVVLDEELEFTRSDGMHATLSMSAAPVRNPAGETIAAVAASGTPPTARSSMIACRRRCSRRSSCVPRPSGPTVPRTNSSRP